MVAVGILTVSVTGSGFAGGTVVDEEAISLLAVIVMAGGEVTAGFAISDFGRIAIIGDFVFVGLAGGAGFFVGVDAVAGVGTILGLAMSDLGLNAVTTFAAFWGLAAFCAVFLAEGFCVAVFCFRAIFLRTTCGFGGGSSLHAQNAVHKKHAMQAMTNLLTRQYRIMIEFFVEVISFFSFAVFFFAMFFSTSFSWAVRP